MNRHLTSYPLMVDVVSLMPTGRQLVFFAETFQNPLCQICTELSEMPDLC